MRDYSKVSPRFWTGDTGKQIRKLGPECQVIAFYLFTCPSANMLGLYYLAMPTLCHETGRPFRGALKALRSLREANFAYYDLPSEQVYVPNMAREQIGDRLTRKDNRHKAVINELERLRKTPFFNEFVNRYRDVFELQDVELEAISRSPLQGPSEPLRSQNQEQEQKQEQKQKEEGRGKRAFDLGSILGLNMEAWDKWIEYRATSKWPIKPVSLQDAAEELAAFGAEQMAVVKKSVASGWRGLFAPKDANGRGHDASAGAKDVAAWAEAHAHARAIGFRDPEEHETASAYMTAIKFAESQPPPIAERRGLAGIKRVQS